MISCPFCLAPLFGVRWFFLFSPCSHRSNPVEVSGVLFRKNRCRFLFSEGEDGEGGVEVDSSVVAPVALEEDTVSYDSVFLKG